MLQIQCALANTGFDEQELINFIKDEVPGVTLYRFNPPPGTFINAAFDWKGLLHDTAAIITVGSVLWNAYVKFVEPLIESGEKPNAGLFLQLKDVSGNSYQVMLGKQFKDKEIFIQDFKEKTSRMTLEFDGEKKKMIVEDIEKSNTWIKIK